MIETDWFRDLAAIDDCTWTMFAEGVASRRSAFNLVTLATVGLDGQPHQRVVVLRGADRAARRLRFHTDARSEKVSALSARPDVEVLAFDRAAKVQVRATGTASMRHADQATAALWGRMNAAAQAPYRQRIAPGTKLSAAAEADDDPLPSAAGAANLVVIEVQVAEIDWLYLAANGHRRARLCYTPPVGATWLAP